MIYTAQTIVGKINEILQCHPTTRSVKLIAEEKDTSFKNVRCISELERAEQTVTLYLVLCADINVNVDNEFSGLHDIYDNMEKKVFKTEKTNLIRHSKFDNDEGAVEVARYTIRTHPSYITVQWCAMVQRAICIWSLFRKNVISMAAINAFHVLLLPFVPEMHWIGSVDGYFGSHHYRVHSDLLHCATIQYLECDEAVNVDKEERKTYSQAMSEVKNNSVHAFRCDTKMNVSNTSSDSTEESWLQDDAIPAAYDTVYKDKSQPYNIFNGNGESKATNNVGSLSSPCQVAVLVNANLSSPNVLKYDESNKRRSDFSVIVLYAVEAKLLTASSTSTALSSSKQRSFDNFRRQENGAKASKTHNFQSDKCHMNNSSECCSANERMHQTPDLFNFVTEFMTRYVIHRVSLHSIFAKWEWEDRCSGGNDICSNTLASSRSNINDNVCKIPSLGTSYRAQWVFEQLLYEEEEEEQQEKQQEWERESECDEKRTKKCVDITNSIIASSCNNKVQNIVFIVNMSMSMWQYLHKAVTNKLSYKYEMNSDMCNEAAMGIAKIMTEALIELSACNMDIFAQTLQRKTHAAFKCNRTCNDDNESEEYVESAATTGVSNAIHTNYSTIASNQKCVYSSEMLINSIATSVASIVAMSSNRTFKRDVERILFSSETNKDSNSNNSNVDDDDDDSTVRNTKAIGAATNITDLERDSTVADDDFNSNPKVSEHSYNDVKYAIMHYLRELSEEQVCFSKKKP